MKKRLLPVAVFFIIALSFLFCEAEGVGINERISIEDEYTVSSAQAVSNEDLLDAYVEALFAIRKPGMLMASNWAGRKLRGHDRTVYNYLKQYILMVASGERESAIFEMPVECFGPSVWTAEQLGVDSLVVDSSISNEAVQAVSEFYTHDFSLIMDTLLADCPYEMYWYDKPTGAKRKRDISLSIMYDDGTELLKASGMFTYSFSVVEDFAGGSNYMFDTSAVNTANAAVENARRIVSEYSSLSDYEKILAYMNSICELTSYNNDAASNSIAYGNPWQLVWVFDNDDSTKVVCEGYAKAFQYLFELSSFEEEIGCITVTGSTGEPHMWNVVTMEDGNHYIVDITNCDQETYGINNQLFLAGYSSGSINDGYQCEYYDTHITYTYDQKTKTLYSNEDLTIVGSSYDPNSDFVIRKGVLVQYRGNANSLIMPSNKGIKEIGNYAFSGNQSVYDVVIPSGIDAIGDGAFANCDNLASVTISRDVRTIGEHAFSQCENLIWISTYGTDTTIAHQEFNGTVIVYCYKNSAISAEMGEYDNCKIIYLDSHIPGSFTVMKLPSELKTIAENTFTNTAPEIVVLPDHISAIGQGAFSGNENLEFVYIPSSVQDIDETSFSDSERVWFVCEPESYAAIYASTNRIPLYDIDKWKKLWRMTD